jgi:hypothetical protein
MKEYIVDISPTLNVVKSLDKKLKRKGRYDIVTDFKRHLRFLSEKICMTDNNIDIWTGDSSIIIKYDEDDHNVLRELLITSEELPEAISFQKNTTPITIFAPVVYYMYPELQRVGRMIVYKRIDQSTKYLVHRSNCSEYPLEHPGGHIEYIEVLPAIDNEARKIRSGKKIIMNVIKNLSLSRDQLVDPLIDEAVVKWAVCGTCRETYEEAGLNLYEYITKIDLIKIGSKTYYFSVKLPTAIKESGPDRNHQKEIFIGNSSTVSKTVSTTPCNTPPGRVMNKSKPIAISQHSPLSKSLMIDTPDDIGCKTHMFPPIIGSLTQYIGIRSESEEENCKTIDDKKSKHNKMDLDEFWSSHCDRSTHHAWISSDEMKMYWDSKYVSHIDMIIATIN